MDLSDYSDCSDSDDSLSLQLSDDSMSDSEDDEQASEIKKYLKGLVREVLALSPEPEAEDYADHMLIPRPKRTEIWRDRVIWHEHMMKDYFDEGCTFTDRQFRNCYPMRRELVVEIIAALENANPYFRRKFDAVGRLGLSAHQNVTAALRILAYGASAESVDEYCRMGKTTALECLRQFCSTIIQLYEGEFLRKPTPEDLRKIFAVNAERGFPGMMGSLDCMHWEWKNCPKAYAGQFSGKEKVPSLVLEAVATQDLWIWHFFFGMPGINNDITVLENSHLFKEFLHDRMPDVQFHVEDTLFTTPYYLVDGIYPPWPTLIPTVPRPVDEDLKLFAKYQEAARKDIERAFGVLQIRWNIVRQPSEFWDTDTMGLIMKTCVLLHNMIIKHEGGYTKIRSKN